MFWSDILLMLSRTWSANLWRNPMKRLIALLALVLLVCGTMASAQVPRTVLAEIGSATW